MSTLGDLVRTRTDLTARDLDHLQRLVAEWQLVADLSFSDLVLWVRTRERSWMPVAHLRPTTASTVYADDVVGLERAASPRLDRVWREGRVERTERTVPLHVRQETVPVRRADTLVALLSRDSNLGPARGPSPLELTYLTSASELLQMVSEGTFPVPGSDPDPEHSPRVGDGQLFKVVNQLLCGVHIAVAGEALALADSMGLDPAQCLEVLSTGAATSFMFEDRGPRMLQGEQAEVRSALDIFVKDMGLVTDAARAVAQPVPLASAAEQLYVRGRREGHGRHDDSSVFDILRSR